MKGIPKMHSIQTLQLKMIKTSRFLKNIEAYKITPQDIWAENAPKDILKIDWNESPKELLFYQEELKKISNERGMIAWYPDYLSIELNNKLAEYLSFDKNNILTFPGSDVGLETLCRAFLDDRDSASCLYPTYENFFVFVLQTGASLKKVEIDKPLIPDENKILNHLCSSKNLKLVYLVNPNNPCGYLLSEEFIRELCKRLPDSIIVVDEAYIEFSDYKSSVTLINEFENLVVFRTFSKAFGMAGLRLGYMCASDEIINAVSKIRNGKNISMISQRLGICALNNISLINDWINEVKKARTDFQDWCIANNLTFYKSNGNFVTFEVSSPKEVCKYLKLKDIYIRNRDSILSNCIRVTIGSRENVQKLISELESIKELVSAK